MITDSDEMEADNNALVESRVSPDGSRSLSKRGRLSPYPTIELSSASADIHETTAVLSYDDQERIATSVLDQMAKLMNHLYIRLNAERNQIRQEQLQANQTLVGTLVLMQQDANVMRNGNVSHREDLRKLRGSIHGQTQQLRQEVDQIRITSSIPRQDEYAPEIQMVAPASQSRKNLLRPEYRAVRYPPPRNPSLSPPVEEQILYTHP